MQLELALCCALAYIACLFILAWRVDRYANLGKSVAQNPYVYSLSLAVYCTAWTFYGSVGRASTSGLSFLAIYLGPTITAPLWLMVLRKMIIISKNQRITSIADFISARFGKSAALATLVTIIAVLGVIPYIAIQLKAVTFSLNLLTGERYDYFKNNADFYRDAAFWVTLAMILFTVLFGARKLDPNERHEGLVASIAFESMVKLIAFFVVGLYVVYTIGGGWNEVFARALENPETRKLFSLSDSGVQPISWNMLLLLSACAILLLPRQFHIAVVENTNPRHVLTAMWMFPLYMLLINIFVFPIALTGKLMLPPEVVPDTYMINLPLRSGAYGIALLAFIGGLSAATSMVIVSTTALSIMVANHLIVPLMIRLKWLGGQALVDGAGRLLDLRRLSIIGVILLAYVYLKSLAGSFDLVSVGLISFTAVAQFTPAAILGMYWKRATPQGAFWGLLIGLVVWAYTLPLPSLAGASLQNGLFGLSMLRPTALFGLEGMDLISHGAFWSLLCNIVAYAAISLYTQPSTLALSQADLFVNIHRYVSGIEYDYLKRAAKMNELRHLLERFLGEQRTAKIQKDFEKTYQKTLSNQQNAPTEYINYAETQLAGAIGAASARLAIDSVAKSEPISLEEMMQVLEQTQEVLRYSKALETKSAELEQTTRQLKAANEQLKALDRLKADFITTVTHELRTPVTSIKSLSKIMLDYKTSLPEEKQSAYLQILVSESDRISRLINQVLDLEKIQQTSMDAPFDLLDLRVVLGNSLVAMAEILREKGIQKQLAMPEAPVWVWGNTDRLTQLCLNILSNAVKFCDPRSGRIDIWLGTQGDFAQLRFQDNGQGIPQSQRTHIFGQFTQLHSAEQGKPQGAGLGLFICKLIVEQHKGQIRVADAAQPGACFEILLPLYPVKSVISEEM